MNKLSAMFAVFRAGASVADPAAWKRKQITATILGGFIIALVQLAGVFGLAIPIDADTATAIAGGIVAVVNVLLTLGTSKSVGLPGMAPVQPASERIAADVPSPQPAPEDAPMAFRQPPSRPLPPVPAPGVDDVTRLRALEWQRQQEQYQHAGG